MNKFCHCGKLLHYNDPEIKAAIEKLVAEKGEFLDVSVVDDAIGMKVTYEVQRHYIALHGLKAEKIVGLGFKQKGIV